MNRYSFILILLFIFFSIQGFSQKERKFIRKGNDLFDEKEYESSEVLYRKALERKDKSFAARFNLGDALFKQKKYDEALTEFKALAATESDSDNLGKLYHNIGNTLLMKREIDESIEAYKESLRYYPDSRETKYNLEYARHLREQEEQQKQQQQQSGKDDKGSKDDKSKKDAKDNKQDKQDEQQNREDKQDKDKAKEDAGKFSEEDANRLLKALQNDEKETQEKVQRELAKQKKAKRTRIEKDW